MSTLQTISKTTHSGKRWKRSGSYQFSAGDAVAPLVAQELPRAMNHLPIGFVRHDDEFVPVAVLGLQPGQNLFVSPDGRWTGGYTPAAYRSYPFRLAESADGQHVLVIDADSGLVSDTGTDTTHRETFFDDTGNPAKAVKDILEFLSAVQADRLATQGLCRVLAKHQLIQPWPITIQWGAGERKVEGLYRIDEAAMNALPAEAFEDLRKTGALLMVYCQLLSMQHLPSLGRLAEARNTTRQPGPDAQGGELNLEFLNTSEKISFGPQ
jgi:hypothetical protein